MVKKWVIRLQSLPNVIAKVVGIGGVVGEELLVSTPFTSLKKASLWLAKYFVLVQKRPSASTILVSVSHML